jgi:peroxiredoxin
MAATESTMLPLGTPLPDFMLPNAVDGSTVSSVSLRGGKGTLVMFICNHCPYVVHIRAKLVEVAHQALDQGFKVVAINSNSRKTHPQDGPQNMKALASQEGWRFPFLFDETQGVAKAFKAACTPDLFLFVEADAGDGARPAGGDRRRRPWRNARRRPEGEHRLQHQVAPAVSAALRTPGGGTGRRNLCC